VYVAEGTKLALAATVEYGQSRQEAVALLGGQVVSVLPDAHHLRFRGEHGPRLLLHDLYNGVFVFRAWAAELTANEETDSGTVGRETEMQTVVPAKRFKTVGPRVPLRVSRKGAREDDLPSLIRVLILQQHVNELGALICLHQPHAAMDRSPADVVRACGISAVDRDLYSHRCAPLTR
jgi:hypothetical protein